MFRRLAQTLVRAATSSTGGVGSASVLAPECANLAPLASCSWLQATGSQPWSGQLSHMRHKYTYAFKKAGNMPGLVFWTPRTPGLRHKISIDYKALGVYTGPPVPELSFRKQNTGGRNNLGHITVRGRGGGIKKILRTVDFKQEGGDTAKGAQVSKGGVVERVEHDPNRTGFIALVRYVQDNGEAYYKYHLAPHGLREGDRIQTGAEAPIQPGNRLQLKDIPLGTPIFNIEMYPGKGGQVARAAGVGASIRNKEEKYAVLLMPSGEVRRLDLRCAATIGSVSNPLNKLTTLGKAGANRLRGRRPKVRGVAMNAVDHPHGGRTNGGRPSCTPWGVYCKGQRTRRRNKPSNALIISRKGGVLIEKFVQAKKWRARAEAERRAKSGAQPLRANPGPPERLLGPVPPKWGVLVGSARGAQAHASA